MALQILRTFGLAVVVLFFFLGGLAHFVFARTEVSIIPEYVPYPWTTNYVVGVLEILGAAGALIRHTRRAATVGLVLLTICVTPANIYMLQQADRFPSIPVWILVARLPLQLLLIALIAWSGGILKR